MRVYADIKVRKTLRDQWKEQGEGCEDRQLVYTTLDLPVSIAMLQLSNGNPED
jgi:hypothetical protein